MRLFEKTLNPGGHDLAEVNQAAVDLQGFACTLSARHIQDGMLRLQFNREVAYYAQGIVRDVETGIKNHEDGLKAIKDEQKSLYDRSEALFIKSIGLAAGFAQMTTALMLCGKGSKLVCRVASSVMATHGVNNTLENTRNLMEDRSDAEGPVRLLYQNIATTVGGSKSQGNIAYGTMDMGLSAYGAFRMVPKPDAWRLWHYLKTDLTQGYKTASGVSLFIDSASTGVITKIIYDEINKNDQ